MKKLAWIIIAVIVVIGIVAYVMNQDSSESSGMQISNEAPTTGDNGANPQTGESAGKATDEDFSDIDEAMNYIE